MLNAENEKKTKMKREIQKKHKTLVFYKKVCNFAEQMKKTGHIMILLAMLYGLFSHAVRSR